MVSDRYSRQKLNRSVRVFLFRYTDERVTCVLVAMLGHGAWSSAGGARVGQQESKEVGGSPASLRALWIKLGYNI